MRKSHDKAEWDISNRERALTPRKTQFWCGCDRVIIRPGAKCPLCHRRPGKRRLLK